MPNAKRWSLWVLAVVAVVGGWVAPLRAAVGGGGDPETDLTNSSSPVTVYHTNAVQGARTDTFLTRVTGLAASGALVYDRSFALPFADPAVQAAVEDARQAILAASAPRLITIQGPALLSSTQDLVASDSQTEETGRSESSVLAGTDEAVGPGIRCLGAGGRLGVVPPTCDPLVLPFLVAAGTVDIQALVNVQTDIFQTITTASTYLLTQHYQLAAQGAAAEVPTLSGGGFLLLALGLAGAALWLLRRGRRLSRGALLAALFGIGGLGGAAAAEAQTLTLASRAAPGFAIDSAGGASRSAGISADGRYTLFFSRAINLVPGQVDTNGGEDLFLRDRVTGATVLVSHAAASLVTASAGQILDAAISADGSSVVFQSSGTDLVAGQVDGMASIACGVGDSHAAEVSNVFLYDRTTGTTSLVSRRTGTPATSADRCSTAPSISDDGRYVAFVSRSSNLVAGQATAAGKDNVFLFDRDNPGATALVSHQSGSAAASGNFFSRDSRISGDGAWVAFNSTANNLVAGQVGSGGVFLYERSTATNIVVSRRSGTTVETGGTVLSLRPALSTDGRYVAFGSPATNLVAGQVDANNNPDLFLFDRVTGANVLVTHASGSPVTASTGFSGANFVDHLTLSVDGRFLAFTDLATDLVAGQTSPAPVVTLSFLFLFDRDSGENQLVARQQGAATVARLTQGAPALSADGRYVAFSGSGGDLVAGQEGFAGLGVFLFDRVAGASVLVSHEAGDPLSGAGFSIDPWISADGAYVAFTSAGTGLVAGIADTNNWPDVFLYERSTATNTLISRRDPGLPSVTPNVESFAFHTPLSSISADGRYLAFATRATRILAGQSDANGDLDVFLFDRVSLSTILVSRRSGTAETTGNGVSDRPVVSADGRYVAFRSTATDLVDGQVDTNLGGDIFLFDRTTGTTVLASHKAGSPARAGNRIGDHPVVSGDGRYVAYESFSTDLAALQVDANDLPDIFLYDRETGTNLLVSRRGGTAATAGSGAASTPGMSGDGRYVAYASLATDLVAGQADANGKEDVFLFDREAGTTVLVSHRSAAPAATANAASLRPAVSADGAWVAFASYATDVVAGQSDANGERDVFLYSRVAGTSVLVSHAAGQPAAAGSNPDAAFYGNVSDSAAISADGRYVAYVSTASNLVAGQVEASFNPLDVFLYDRATGANVLVSHASGQAATTAGSLSVDPALSADGRWVAFTSVGQNLVAGLDSGLDRLDIFLFDRATGAVTLASHGNGPATRGDGDSFYPLLAAGGAWGAFASFADNLDLLALDANDFRDVYLFMTPP
jgi:Tol biopolymer transport system component